LVARCAYPDRGGRDRYVALKAAGAIRTATLERALSAIKQLDLRTVDAEPVLIDNEDCRALRHRAHRE
jgi:hypothetical protein